ncbi:MAG TPA: chorismate mutase [Bacteroidales bacterium]|nr:chorismate mutase [Bacteroidales bacterium]
MNAITNNLASVGRPLIIAGPCAVENRKQVIGTARELAGVKGIFAFRAGLWKPRTRPGDFEGVGEKGIPWLKEVKQLTGLKLAVEVAIPSHVDACISAGIDIVWIGARTVVSPFIVDEIARALKGSDICVMVKNPVNPDLSLWAGGIERLKKSGIENLAAVHRGFDAYSSLPYRNIPLWEIPIELRRLFPGLPMLCDPSHIGGRRELIGTISQKAFDLGMDGLMIEAHIDPANALTDISQQVHPAELAEILAKLVIRKEEEGPAEVRLEKYRSSLDEIDRQLLELLSKRMGISALIGEYKRERNLAPFQPERWKAVLNDRIEKGTSLQLDKDFLKRLFDLIHIESIRRQG